MREAYIREVDARMAPYDAFLVPTAPCVAPTIAEASASDEAYFRWNGRILRNTGLVNFLDGCAATLPCHARGEAPVGLMVCGVAMADRHVLAVARALEGILAGRA
jgi:aspartyl-tRNA(Asn)/glutamyl-tRNA(Gln) amidotransferase subunit A